MKMVSKLALASAVLGTLTLGTAFASPIELQLTSGGSNSGIIFGSAGTPSDAIFSNVDFNGWRVSLAFGESNSPSLMPSGLDLTALTATCITGGGCSTDNLVVSISDVGFTQGVGSNGFLNSLSGTLVGSGMVSQAAYFDSGDAYFDQSGVIGTVTLNGPGTPGGSIAGGGPAGPAAYSLTLLDTFSAGKGVSYSTDGNVTAVPEPATLALFAAGLLGCAVGFRRRRTPNA